MSSKPLRLSAKAITNESLSPRESVNDSLNVFSEKYAFQDESLKGQSQLRLSFSAPPGETLQERRQRLLSGLRVRPRRGRRW